MGCVPVLAALLLSLVLAPPTEATTVDHSKLDELQGPFERGEDVTRACLRCHTEAATQVMATPHWTWEYEDPLSEGRLGKKTMINGFCIGLQSNEAFCTSCHVGYGWEDDTFDFADQSRVDCLACHNTGGYSKLSGMAGHPPYERIEWPAGSGRYLEPVDLASVAQRVALPSRETCGSCHFYGGGGDGVKHGDLDSSLVDPPKSLDVHMASDGLNFRCIECHVTENHVVPGSRLDITAADPHGPIMRGRDEDRNPATCQACHGDRPHSQGPMHAQRLNDHARTLACQSCHIPTYARGGVATKMRWDWSTAGRLDDDGRPFLRHDDKGRVIYDSRKGDYTLGENVVPAYVWFDGRVRYLQPDAVIDPEGPVRINEYLGRPGAENARIWPVKRYEGRQPYDTVHRTLLVPNVAVHAETAFWLNFEWPAALRAGMEASGRPYSGEFDFVDTLMLWPITHMVAPAEQALQCADCHTVGGRLEGVPGIWMPGRDRNRLLDLFGFGLAGLMLLGVVIHGGLRVGSRRRLGGR
ncbi:cytochrome C [Thioalkalivibrio denitrificans]|uniref:Cytochrome C n=2 Tax=Thioalkalivibrio denitrificans TaxID=108003 RepID=A0A1V3NM93_9GAMM|nr:cytochrome C [Thioalkalivibrio denitrificans]